MDQLEMLSEDQRQRLAAQPVWIDMRAGDVLLWRDELRRGVAKTVGEENRRQAVKLLMQQVGAQLGDLPLNQWADQQVRVSMILPMAIDRIGDLTGPDCRRDRIAQASVICQAIGETLSGIDWLPAEVISELEQSHAEVRNAVDQLLADDLEEGQ